MGGLGTEINFVQIVSVYVLPLLGGYNRAAGAAVGVRLQWREMTSSSSRELRPVGDACRAEEFPEIALEELGSSIWGSWEKHEQT